ncbi:hypothetical protein DPEC_G00119000 [Dallia pectoralis]|uniref:Uncharacterized protein n=1 Tax=Dallia pectoralis TaxID=75939 RepID=A0ACC2GPA3_DALPE|nr:hypothetical protein DPEC_G00119000 [Dallia pectoralis]
MQHHTVAVDWLAGQAEWRADLRSEAFTQDTDPLHCRGRHLRVSGGVGRMGARLTGSAGVGIGRRRDGESL